MLVAIKNLQTAAEDAAIHLTAAADTVISGNEKPLFRAGEIADAEKLSLLEINKITEIDVILTKELLRGLNRINPSQYKLPVKVLDIDELEKEISFIEFANARSRLSRRLLSCCEWYRVRENVRERVIDYNQEINRNSLEKIRFESGDSCYVAVRYSEFKVAVLVDFRPAGDDFSDRFRMNTNIVYALTQNLSTISELRNLSLLNVRDDIYIIDDPGDLYDVYLSGSIRLIVIGRALSAEYRDALVKIKKYDPYARFMLVKHAPKDGDGQFLLNVEMNYIRDNWK